MKKKIFALTLSPVMLCFVLSGCSENETYSSWIENVQSASLTQDITATASGFGIDENTCYVKVTFSNTSVQDLGIIIEKVVPGGSSEIEIGTDLIAIAGGETDAVITFDIDMDVSAITDADIYVIINGEETVYHLDLE